MAYKPQVTIVGAGMIVHDQILPSLYQMQRIGRIGEITVCGTRTRAVEALAKDKGILCAFPGQSFRAMPDSGDPDKLQPDLFRSVIEGMPPGNIVFAAVPDQLHSNIIHDRAPEQPACLHGEAAGFETPAGAGDRARGDVTRA